MNRVFVLSSLCVLVACGSPGPASVIAPSPKSDAGADDRDPEAAIENGSLGGACYGNGTCNAGLACVASVCERPATGALGGACYGNGTCNTGLVCESGTCLTRVAENEGGLGEACVDGFFCSPPLVCSDDGVCETAAQGTGEGTTGDGESDGEVTDGDVVAGASPALPVPTATLTAFPATIDEGSFSVLSWTSSNATDCELLPDLGAVTTTGQRQVEPVETTTYTLTCTNEDNADAEATATATVTVNPAVRIVSFTGNGTAGTVTIDEGESLLLAWTTEAADACSIDQGTGAVQTNGTTSVSPTTSKTYTLSCEGVAGPATKTLAVTVNPAVRILTFTAASAAEATIDWGQSVTLAWTSENATGCSLSDGTTPTVVATSSTRTLSPTVDTLYTLTCEGVAGPVSATVTVYVNQPVAIGSFTATPQTIDYGQFSLLAWSTSNAASCEITGIGAVAGNGTTQVNPTTTTVYTLTCTGVGGTKTSTLTVTVLPPVTINSFTINDDTPDYKQSITATWTTSNASSCTLDDTNRGTNGSYSFVKGEPGSTYTVKLVCQGVAGPVEQSKSVTVNNKIYVGDITLCGAGYTAGSCTNVGTTAGLTTNNTIQGNVTFRGIAASSIPAFTVTRTITGNLVYEDVIGPFDVDTGSIKTIQGNLSVASNACDSLGTEVKAYVYAPELTNIDGNLTMSCGHIPDMTFPALSEVKGVLSLLYVSGLGYDGNSKTKACSDAAFPKLQKLGRISITSNSGSPFNSTSSIKDEIFPILKNLTNNASGSTYYSRWDRQDNCDAWKAALTLNAGTFTVDCATEAVGTSCEDPTF